MKHKIELLQIKHEHRVIELEANTQSEAENLVAEGINALGFSEIGELCHTETEEQVNGHYLDQTELIRS